MDNEFYHSFTLVFKNDIMKGLTHHSPESIIKSYASPESLAYSEDLVEIKYDGNTIWSHPVNKTLVQ